MIAPLLYYAPSEGTSGYDSIQHEALRTKEVAVGTPQNLHEPPCYSGSQQSDISYILCEKCYVNGVMRQAAGRSARLSCVERMYPGANALSLERALWGRSNGESILALGPKLHCSYKCA